MLDYRDGMHSTLLVIVKWFSKVDESIYTPPEMYENYSCITLSSKFATDFLLFLLLLFSLIDADGIYTLWPFEYTCVNCLDKFIFIFLFAYRNSLYLVGTSSLSDTINTMCSPTLWYAFFLSSN